MARIHTQNPIKSGSAEFTYIDLSSVDNRAKRIVAPSVLATAEAPSRARQVVSSGDVLVSTVRPNLNAVATVPEELDGATASTGFTVLRPNQHHLEARYVFHWVRSPKFIGDMVQKATGASYPAVSDRIVKESLIPLPELTEQCRIANILDKVDDLCTKRRETIAHFDGLRQSIFHEMFGRSEAAPRVSLSDVLRNGLRNGLSPSTKGDVVGEVLTLSAITGSELDLSQKKAGRFDSEFHIEQFVRSGQILICRGNGNKALVGKGKVVQETSLKVGYPDTIIAGDINASIVEPRFLQSAWESLDVRGQIERGARTTNGTFKVNQNLLGTVNFPLPPMNLQQEFANRVAVVENLKSKHLAQLAELDELFLSLQDRAFKGEL